MTYVGSEACIECHEAEYHAWMGSDHQRAMLHPDHESVEADFNNTTFERGGITTRFHTNEETGEFLITTDGPDGMVQTFPVSYTFGFRPLQQFLIPIGNGRHQALTIAWDTANREWFDLYPHETISDHTDELHWTGRNFTWNHMCAACHSTNVRKNFDLETNTYDTTYSEVMVGCEACHGPGSRHVELARKADPPDWDGDVRMGLSIRYTDRLENMSQIEACAGCHSRRTTLHEGFFPGRHFLDYYQPEFLEDHLYFSDGQIKDEVFVYGSFLQSRMHRENVRCTDCHDAHTNRIKFEGNRLCTQCHVATVYDTPLHHHHEVATEAALCIECHMPERTYMVFDPRRDHGMKIPRPDLTVKYGIPNACNTCHTAEDEDAEWAAEAVVKWYGEYRPDDPHFAHAFAAARAGEFEAIEPLVAVVTDADRHGPITRATAATLLGPYTYDQRARESLRDALSDDEPLVQIGAIRALEYSLDEETASWIIPLVKHSRRAVRIEAARVLAEVLTVAPEEILDQKRHEQLRRAIEEYKQSLAINLDIPDAHLNLGVLHSDLGNDEQALKDYQTAIRLDDDYVPARVNLAMLHYAHNRLDDAERELKEVVKRAPDFADGHFMLALLVAEHDQRTDEAIALLERAVEIEPTRAEFQYNLGVASLQAGRSDRAKMHLVRAAELQPGNLAYIDTLLRTLIEQKQWDDALRWVEQMIDLQPNQQAWLDLRDWLEVQQMNSGDTDDDR